MDPTKKDPASDPAGPEKGAAPIWGEERQALQYARDANCLAQKLERPNTVAGLVAKRDELVKLRDQLEADIRAITVDVDHLEAAIRIFDPENTPEARRRYAAMHRAPKGQSTRFVLSSLRTATAPMTSREIAQAWAKARGLDASDATLATLTKRIGATLRALKDKATVRQDGHCAGLIGWRLVK